MRNALFENSRNAVIFGGCILLGAVVLIGEEDDEGALVAAANESAVGQSGPRFASGSDAGIREYVSDKEAQNSARGPGWSSDGDLMDAAAGFDAAPTATSGVGATEPAGPGSLSDGPRRPGIDGPNT